MKTLLSLIIGCFLLSGCARNSSGWPVIPFLHNGGSQRAALTTEQRDRKQFAANQPTKGANRAEFPVVRQDRTTPATVKESLTVQLRTELIAPPFPDDDSYCPTCVGAQPMNATFSFTVVERSPGAHGGPYSYGLKRSFDGGKTWAVWTRWVNDTFAYNFQQSVTLMCDGPGNKLIQVGTWASATP